MTCTICTDYYNCPQAYYSHKHTGSIDAGKANCARMYDERGNYAV